MDKGSIHPSTDFRTKLIRPLRSRTLASRRIEQRPVSVEILSDCSLLICAIKLYNPISCHQFMDLDLGIRMVIWKSRSHESHLILPNSYAVFYRFNFDANTRKIPYPISIISYSSRLLFVNNTNSCLPHILLQPHHSLPSLILPVLSLCAFR